ncbi:hypothetical protein SCLCIDRAFT_1213084 [Scleroderma citrinum Foug A]|uniref:Uncharacterized protein n=1 Tax=Scleroderma citrinum Foug A TaxID=1036808 RepID=A0A0C3E8A4_9AGAM|nr:hypothetical protein SCLCIDRAFT_1213084 [Scleroderma citrinum Foug A]
MAMTSSEGTLLVIKKRCIADYEWMQAVRVVPQRGPKESRKVQESTGVYQNKRRSSGGLAQVRWQ